MRRDGSQRKSEAVEKEYRTAGGQIDTTDLRCLLKKKKKKSETELTASVLIKDSKQTRDQQTLFIGRNRTERVHLRGSPLFQATYNIKTEKKKKHQQLIQLIMCQLGVGGWWKEKGRRLTFSSPCLLLIIVVGMRVAVFVDGFMLLEKTLLMKCLARKNKTKQRKE